MLIAIRSYPIKNTEKTESLRILRSVRLNIAICVVIIAFLS